MSFKDSKDKVKSNIIFGICFIIIGIICEFFLIRIIPDKGFIESIIFLLGIFISIIGIRICINKVNSFALQFMILTIVSVSIFAGMAFIMSEYAYSTRHPNSVPSVYFKKIEYGNVTKYKSFFFNMYKVKPSRSSNGLEGTTIVKEYYLLDNKNEYTIESVPNTIFDVSKFETIDISNYKNNSVKDEAGVTTLIYDLPLGEFQKKFEIDMENCGLAINYNIYDITDKDIYVKKALIFNVVSRRQLSFKSISPNSLDKKSAIIS